MADSIFEQIMDYLGLQQPQGNPRIFQDQQHTHQPENERAQTYGQNVPGTDLPYSQYYDRVDRGWSPEDAMASPPRSLDQRIGTAVGGLLEQLTPVEFSALTPVIGDFTGPIADLNVLKQEPEARTLGNYFLTGVGALPMVPSVLGMTRKADPNQIDMFKDREPKPAIFEGRYAPLAGELKTPGHRDPSTFSSISAYKATPPLMKDLPEGGLFKRYDAMEVPGDNESTLPLYSKLGVALDRILARPGQAKTTTMTDLRKQLSGQGVTEQEIAEAGLDLTAFADKQGKLDIATVRDQVFETSPLNQMDAYTFAPVKQVGDAESTVLNEALDTVHQEMTRPGLVHRLMQGETVEIQGGAQAFEVRREGTQYVAIDPVDDAVFAQADDLAELEVRVQPWVRNTTNNSPMMESRVDEILDEWEAPDMTGTTLGPPKWERHLFGQFNADKVEERVLASPQIFGYESSTHYPEAGKGYIAHVRTSGRTAYADGQEIKVRHIDEVQSDLHQKAQTYGYSQYETPTEAHRAANDLTSKMFDLEQESMRKGTGNKLVEMKNYPTRQADFQADYRRLRGLLPSNDELAIKIPDELETIMPNDRDAKWVMDNNNGTFAQVILKIGNSLPQGNAMPAKEYTKYRKFVDQLKRLPLTTPEARAFRDEKVAIAEAALNADQIRHAPPKNILGDDKWIKATINDAVVRAADKDEEWVSLSKADQQVRVWNEKYRKAYTHTYDEKGTEHLKKLAKDLGAEFKMIELKGAPLSVDPATKAKNKKLYTVPAIRLTPEIRKKLKAQGLPLYGKVDENQPITNGMPDIFRYA